MATLKSDQVCNSSHPIKFDDVRINLNNCYDKSDGIFRAPIKGLYLFYFTVDIESNDVTEIQIWVDSKLFLNTLDGGSIFNGGRYGLKKMLFFNYEYIDIGKPKKRQTPSNTFSLSLNEGQTVYLKVTKSCTVHSWRSRYSWFGGHLIQGQ